MSREERNRNRTGRRDRSGSHGKNKKKHIMRGIILVILCVCVLGILELIASIFLGGNGKNSEIWNAALKKNAVKQTVNKEKLVSLINNTEQINKSVYTEESVAVLDQNITDALSALNVASTQEELDNHYLAIVKSIQSLKKSDDVARENSAEQEDTELNAVDQSSNIQPSHVSQNTAVGIQ